MERVTISLDETLLEAFDAFIKRKGYENRSEAIRDLLRAKLMEADRLDENRAPYAIACLSYVFDHHQRDLASRLTAIQHGQHDLVLSATHVHMDHDTCLEAVILRGPTEAIQRFSNAIMAETGVRHSKVHVVPVKMSKEGHGHGDGHRHHGDEGHLHSCPAT
ncbi:nickel-responsive regulator [Alphaproteobacteria bacterium]|nr:nickel-responsive regulator [Alphaproteobacteria bacterium]